MSVQHGPGEAYRAVLEGVAFAVERVFRQVQSWCGEPRRIRITGGGARSALWVDILAAVLGRPLELTDEAAEGRGAAIFLAVGLGFFPDVDAAADALVQLDRRVDPVPELAEAYRRLAEDWAHLDRAARGYEPSSSG